MSEARAFHTEEVARLIQSIRHAVDIGSDVPWGAEDLLPLVEAYEALEAEVKKLRHKLSQWDDFWADHDCAAEAAGVEEEVTP